MQNRREMVKVNIKWNKSSYDLDVSTEEPSVDLLKAQLYELTNVPIERQKLMLKGKPLKADEELAKVTDGAKIVLMGTADEVSKPAAKIVFEEDLSDEQKAVMVPAAFPPGLKNLGNTCYMNSTLQCLKAIPSLKTALETFSFERRATASVETDPNNLISIQLGRLFTEMDRSIDAVVPGSFTSAFQQIFPQFAQKSPEGYPMQQDADESLIQLLYCVNESIKPSPVLAGGARSLFELHVETKISCTEAAEEPPTTRFETFNKLRCHITGTTNYLSEGIKDALVENIEKNSPTLGRNAVYKKVDAITKLPQVLVVQFVRFFWKADTKVKSKILRKVTFPMRLDVLEFCSESLKKQIVEHRNIVDAEFEAKSAAPKDSGDKMDVDTKPPETDPNLTGNYELFGVITHKGRTADSGHYIGWTQDTGDDWFQYDDDKVSKVKSEDVLKLSGGGDWHMAYILFYRSAPWRIK